MGRSRALVCYGNREVSHFLQSPVKNEPQVKAQLAAILLPNKTTVMTLTHTRTTEPEYPGNARADFNTTSASTQTLLVCNLNKLQKTDSNQIIHDNLYKRQNPAPELERQH